MSIRPRNNKPTLVWFHKNGCPYCVQMKDEWEKTVTSLRTSGKANTEEYEKHGNPEIMREYGITSYPTIVLITPNGKRIDYNGRRNASSMVEFASRDRTAPEVILFHMNGCGHCRAMMPEWEKFKKKHPKGIKVLDFESDISIINIGKFGLFNITAFQNQYPNYDYIPWRGPQGQINDKPPYHSWDYKTYNDMSIGYIIEYNGLRICFADAPLIKNPSVIGDVDILIHSIAVRAYNNISKCLEELRPTYYIPAHYDDFFQPFKTIDRSDTLIGTELSFRKSKKSSNTSSLLNYTRYDEFFSEFNDQYIPEAMTSKKLIIEPKLRLLKPMYYYLIESLIVK